MEFIKSRLLVCVMYFYLVGIIDQSPLLAVQGCFVLGWHELASQEISILETKLFEHSPILSEDQAREIKKDFPINNIEGKDYYYFYHGTTRNRVPRILQEGENGGLQPPRSNHRVVTAGEVTEAQQAHRKKLIYLSPSSHYAKSYAETAAGTNPESAVLLRVKIAKDDVIFMGEENWRQNYLDSGGRKILFALDSEFGVEQIRKNPSFVSGRKIVNLPERTVIEEVGLNTADIWREAPPPPPK